MFRFKILVKVFHLYSIEINKIDSNNDDVVIGKKMVKDHW